MEMLCVWNWRWRGEKGSVCVKSIGNGVLFGRKNEEETKEGKLV